MLRNVVFEPAPQSVLDSEWMSRAAFGVAAALLMSFCLF
jgi:hypothetical protein